MHRPGAVARPRSICQICESLSTQRRRALTPLTATRKASQSLYQSRQRLPSSFISPQSRASSSAVFPGRKRAPAPATKIRPDDSARAETDDAAVPSLDPSVIANNMSLLETSASEVYDAPGIPPEESVAAALQVCDRLADWLTNEPVQPQIAHAFPGSDSTASTLLSLDGVTKTTKPKTQPSKLPEGIEYSAKLRELVSQVSETAYSLLAHPPVFITPNLLRQYVEVQAKLGRPETLPRVFQLFASKPLAREGSVPLRYVKQNPNRISNAIESEVVEAALDTAIGTKNLDAAVGIVENSYGTKAYVRSKLLRHGLLPLTTFAATPVAAYILASNFSGVQQTMDGGVATGIAFTGILAYVGFTGSLGLVAFTTANDQMKRVRWAPGIALRMRWIREEERAALDKIACAWGFQEEWRHGDEEGADWNALREYIGQKGMILDQSELMAGMD
ncbi:hypothetical protein GGS24DRAFT_474498 [Hypoxylon argillaceum]|nr:hypothetical protein GGS24DRAFT_474498 [Hypoxylon argillaceum]